MKNLTIENQELLNSYNDYLNQVKIYVEKLGAFAKEKQIYRLVENHIVFIKKWISSVKSFINGFKNGELFIDTENEITIESSIEHILYSIIQPEIDEMAKKYTVDY